MSENYFSTRHPHEPEIPPAYDNEGRCLICGLQLELAQAQADVEALRQLKDAAAELHEVACLRGDNDLPHPADDPLLWTARMQDAWDELAVELAALPERLRGASR